MASQFPGTSVDSFATLTDGSSTVLAAHQNDRAAGIVSTQTKVGVDADPLSATTLEGRAKWQEAGGLKRGSSIASATSITLVDTAQVFPITGTTPIATIAAPSYPRLVLLEFASALTLAAGTGNLALPGGADLAVEAGAVLALEWTGTAWQVVGGSGGGATVDPAATVGGLRTLGTGALQAAAGNDSRFTSHATRHVTVGQDPIATFTATTRGLVPPPGGSPTGVKALYDNGTWADPAVASGGMSSPLTVAGGLIIGDATGDPVELPPGTDGQVLGVDPTDHQVKFINVPSKHVIYDETSPVTDRAVLAFQGAGVTVTDDATDGATLVTIPGGGGGAVFSTSTDGLVPGPSGSEDDATHVLAGDGTWLDTSTLGGGGGSGGGTALWDPAGLAVPPVVAALSVHDHWATTGGGFLTALTQYGDVAVFANPGSSGTVERGAFGTTSGPYAVPAPPYTVTACLLPNLEEGDYWACQLSLRDSASDKRESFRLFHDTALKMSEIHFTDYQTFAAASTGQPCTQGTPVWLRIRDDASNRLFEYSRDGLVWNVHASQASAFFCVPDQAGITTDTFGTRPGTQGAVTLLSLSVVNTA